MQPRTHPLPALGLAQPTGRLRLLQSVSLLSPDRALTTRPTSATTLASATRSARNRQAIARRKHS